MQQAYQTERREGPLSVQATEMLRQNGYTWSGRPKEEVDVIQALFESRGIIKNQNGPWRHNSRRA